MLVIARKEDEGFTLRIGGEVVARIVVLEFKGNRVQLGVAAEKHVIVLRDEIPLQPNHVLRGSKKPIEKEIERG